PKLAVGDGRQWKPYNAAGLRMDSLAKLDDPELHRKLECQRQLRSAGGFDDHGQREGLRGGDLRGHGFGPGGRKLYQQRRRSRRRARRERRRTSRGRGPESGPSVGGPQRGGGGGGQLVRGGGGGGGGRAAAR